MFRALGDRRWCANALNSLGFMLRDRGAFARRRVAPEEPVSLYMRGGGDESGLGIATDCAGAAYLAGRTGGTLCVTSGWFNPACLDPAGFVAKLNPAGARADTMAALPNWMA
jgi:hypothetical protein